MNSQPLQRQTVRYSGRVQGVGFRYTTRSISRGHNVTGYVQNMPDGSVEMVAEGVPREIEAFRREIRDHFLNNIRSEQSDTQTPSGEFTSFDIRH